MRISDWSSDVCSSDLYGLGSICEHRNAPFMGKPNNCLEWRQYPENIRHVRDRHKARAMRDGVSESGGIEIDECVRDDPEQDDDTPLPKQKPRHQKGGRRE